jgi:shikimate kinase
MPADSDSPAQIPDPAPAFASRTIALVGLMGAGKSTVGRRLAEKLGRKFYDSDHEIEKAAGLSVADIFTMHGEADFRRGEQKVLERLLSEEPHVLATGGGAYLNEETRVLQALLLEREPVYSQADLIVHSKDGPHGTTVNAIIKALKTWKPA